MLVFFRYLGINGFQVGYMTFFFFFLIFLSGFSSQTLTIHRTAGEGRGPSFIPLFHFHPLTNIETFIFNFACEMTITYFQSQRLYLPDYYSMRFYHLIELPFEWLIDDVMFVCVLDELILDFCYSDLTFETGGFELASTIILVSQANRLTKYASHPKVYDYIIYSH